MLDENEFLSPFGIRSVSKFHKNQPYIYKADGQEWRVDYCPGEGTAACSAGTPTGAGRSGSDQLSADRSAGTLSLFLRRRSESGIPRALGKHADAQQVARELAVRLTRTFLPDATGHRPCHGKEERYASDPHWKDLCLYYEYFHAETGRGCGASHQTGWTALVARIVSGFAPGGASGADSTTADELKMVMLPR